MSQGSSSHSFTILFSTSICPTFRERERFPNEAEVRGRGYGVVIAHTSDHDHNDHDDGEDDHIDGENDDNNDHKPFPRYGPAYLRPLRYAAPPLGQALRSVGSPATALAGGVGETVQPRALKSDPTEILPLIHGNILSQYPVCRVTPGRFVDPSAWTRKTQIGGDSVKKSVVNKSKSSGLSPLNPCGNRFGVLQDINEGINEENEQDAKDARDDQDATDAITTATTVQSEEGANADAVRETSKQQQPIHPGAQR